MKERGRELRVECLKAWAPGGEEILRCIDFEAYPGEVVIVAGRSGSGKTTLLRLLAGVASLYGIEYDGVARYRGVDLAGGGGLEEAAYVPQEPWYAIASPYVATELGQLGLGVEEARRELEKLGIGGKLFSSTLSLSAGEAERLALLVATIAGRSLLLVDEVSSYLDPCNRRRAVLLLRRLADEGRVVVVVDHYLDLWSGVADKVVFLEKGKSRVYGRVEETPIYWESKRLGERIGERRGGSGGELLLLAERVWYRYPDTGWVLRGVELEARSGEIVWVRGRSGAGKSTLLKILAGLYKPSRGRVERRGSVQYVPENPILYFTEPTVGEELGGDFALASRLGLDAGKPIGVLSSGEKRRLAIGSAYLRTGGRGVVLIDEPTIGLDPWAASTVLGLLVELAGSGAGVVVASHAPEVGLVADRLVEVG